MSPADASARLHDGLVREFPVPGEAPTRPTPARPPGRPRADGSEGPVLARTAVRDLSDHLAVRDVVMAPPGLTPEVSGWIGATLSGGRYQVTAKLGEGGMGFVLKALDRNLDTPVVIKVPRSAMLEDPTFAGRFA